MLFCRAFSSLDALLGGTRLISPRQVKGVLVPRAFLLRFDAI